jgi:hypothetical protein
MDLVCKLIAQSGIYEDGDYWVTTDRNDKNPERILKLSNPYYPLSAVMKYDAEPVNQRRLDELSILFDKGE